jgi:hypothetical protein
MVEMGTIRKRILLACRSCSAPTPSPRAVATAIPSADREEKISWTDRGSHILHGNAVVQR